MTAFFSLRTSSSAFAMGPRMPWAAGVKFSSWPSTWSIFRRSTDSGSGNATQAHDRRVADRLGDGIEGPAAAGAADFVGLRRFSDGIAGRHGLTLQVDW